MSKDYRKGWNEAIDKACALIQREANRLQKGKNGTPPEAQSLWDFASLVNCIRLKEEAE